MSFGLSLDAASPDQFREDGSTARTLIEHSKQTWRPDLRALLYRIEAMASIRQGSFERSVIARGVNGLGVIALRVGERSVNEYGDSKAEGRSAAKPR